MPISESEFKGACQALSGSFATFVKYQQEQLKNEVFNSSDFETMKIKFNYLSELETLIKNETTNTTANGDFTNDY